MALLFVDLDNFGASTTAWASASAMSCCWRWCAGFGACCGKRYPEPSGGDEFLIVLRTSPHGDTAARAADEILAALWPNLFAPRGARNCSLAVSWESPGYPDDGEGLRNSPQERRHGPRPRPRTKASTYRFFASRAMNRTVEERLLLYAGGYARHSIKAILSSTTNPRWISPAVAFFRWEALLRLKHPDAGSVQDPESLLFRSQKKAD